MTLDELIEALGFKSDGDKDKIAVLKKEFNAKTKEVNTANKKLEALNEQVESAKAVTDKFEIVKKFFSLDTEAEDFDAMLDEVKDNLIKDAGGGATPEEIKNLKRELTKANREKDKVTKALDELNARLAQEKQIRIKNNVNSEIRKALDTYKVIKPEQMIDLFANRVNVDDDGETFTIKADDGSELSINDYIADWSKDNPEFVMSGTKGGAGTNGSSFDFGFGSNANNKPTSDMDKLMSSIIGDTTKDANAKSLSDIFG